MGGRPRLTRTGGRSPDRFPGFLRRPGKAAGTERDPPRTAARLRASAGGGPPHGEDGTGSHLPPLGKPA